jgi:hypothetical protein
MAALGGQSRRQASDRGLTREPGKQGNRSRTRLRSYGAGVWLLLEPRETGNRDAVQWLALSCAIVSVISIALLFNEFHAISSDAGQHYALVRALMDQDGWGRPVAPYLAAELTSYPPLSHWLAAEVGKIAGSGFVGMTVIASASVGSFYFAMNVMSLRIDWRAPLIASAITIAYALLRGPVFGHLVVNNYFYAQVVGSSIAVLTMLLVFSKLHKWNGVAIDLVVVVAVQIVVATHLMPAAQLSACYCMVLLVLALKRSSRVIAGRLILFVALTLLLTRMSPFAADVYRIAQAEGGAHINLFGYRAAQIVLLLGGVAASLSLIRKDRENEDAGLILGCMGLGTCAFAALQIVLFWFGIGSHYAIAKNMFLVVAVLIFVFSANLALARKPVDSPWKSIPAGLVACSLLALLTTRADMFPSVVNLGPVVQFQEAARTMAARLNPDDIRRPIAISSLWPRNLSYGMTIGDMRLRMGVGEMILTDQAPPADHVSVMFLPKGDPAVVSNCLLDQYSNDIAVAMDYPCFTRLPSRLLLLKAG